MALRDKTALSGRLRAAVDFFLRSNTRNRLLTRVLRQAQTKTYDVALPAGYPASRVRVTLSLPGLRSPQLEFCEHVTDAAGCATGMIVASTFDGFAVSRDLGATWKFGKVKGYERHRVLHLKWLGQSELLALVVPSREDAMRSGTVTLVVVNEEGDVAAAHEIAGGPWHSCRAVDMAGGTLMYAEYPYEDSGAKRASRVFRSRDRGRSWQVVKTEPQIRHFHFLQARPGFPGEWWLSSGDEPAESKIWVSRDDGDSWQDLTGGFGGMIDIGGESFPRSLFRLTDLAWHDGEIVWGTDDDLRGTRNGTPGPRVFRSACTPLDPQTAGRATFPIRNIIDVGDYFVLITQGGGNRSPSRKPGVFLTPKKPVESAPALVHLFDVDTRSTGRSGFTYSRASRAAMGGTFFTFRASTDAFPAGPKLLRWDIALLD